MFTDAVLLGVEVCAAVPETMEDMATDSSIKHAILLASTVSARIRFYLVVDGVTRCGVDVRLQAFRRRKIVKNNKFYFVAVDNLVRLL